MAGAEPFYRQNRLFAYSSIQNGTAIALLDCVCLNEVTKKNGVLYILMTKKVNFEFYPRQFYSLFLFISKNFEIYVYFYYISNFVWRNKIKWKINWKLLVILFWIIVIFLIKCATKELFALHPLKLNFQNS